MMTPDQPLKMVLVDAKLFSAIGYVDATRQLYIKFHATPALCFNSVPRFHR